MTLRFRGAPWSMANQLVLLLVVALLIANMVAMVVIQKTGALIHPLSRTLALERLASAYRSVADESSGAHLPEMSTSDARFWIDAVAEVQPFSLQPEESRLADDLGRLLHLETGTAVIMQLERDGGAFARVSPFRLDGHAPLRLRTSIPLADGRYLNAIQYPARAYEWSRLLAYVLPVTSVPLLVLLVFFVRRVVRPVRLLARATEQVSRGEWVAPLPLQGPWEARELTRSFNLMQARIARHVESRTRMLAALSHDLNTPITELRLQVELVDDAALRSDLLDSLGELQAMVGETLDFLRGDAVQERHVRIRLDHLLEEVARRYRTLGQPVHCLPGPPLECLGRPLALKRALTNLIDNALHHAGDAEVRLSLEGEDRARLTILDQGPGLPPEWLDKVFEPFVQGTAGEARNRGEGAGMGLGLAIARACVQSHGGELWLENRRPAGLCAVMLLPLAN